MKKNAPLLVIVSSPSGAGKTTLCQKLLNEFDDLRFSTSHTTRKPRPGEVDGKDYHFVSESDFEKMIENDLFLEWAWVHGNRYGTARAEIRAAANQGNDLIFDVDFQGAKQIRASSRLDEVMIGKPKDIFRRFRRLGIYKWEDIFEIAKRDVNADVMALRFSETELFSSPIPWQELQGTLRANNITTQLQSPVTIQHELFEQLYLRGTKGDSNSEQC